jgi:hypothetical protein
MANNFAEREYIRAKCLMSRGKDCLSRSKYLDLRVQSGAKVMASQSVAVSIFQGAFIHWNAVSEVTGLIVTCPLHTPSTMGAVTSCFGKNIAWDAFSFNSEKVNEAIDCADDLAVNQPINADYLNVLPDPRCKYLLLFEPGSNRLGIRCLLLLEASSWKLQGSNNSGCSERSFTTVRLSNFCFAVSGLRFTAFSGA